MKTTWAGKCSVCGGAIPMGTDVFYERAAGTQHWECHDNPPPSPEQVALAERLGFLPWGQALTISWTLVHKYERLRNGNHEQAVAEVSYVSRPSTPGRIHQVGFGGSLSDL